MMHMRVHFTYTVNFLKVIHIVIDARERAMNTAAAASTCTAVRRSTRGGDTGLEAMRCL